MVQRYNIIQINSCNAVEGIRVPLILNLRYFTRQDVRWCSSNSLTCTIRLSVRWTETKSKSNICITIKLNNKRTLDKGSCFIICHAMKYYPAPRGR